MRSLHGQLKNYYSQLTLYSIILLVGLFSFVQILDFHNVQEVHAQIGVGNGADQIDLSQVTIVNSPDVRNWAMTAAITGINLNGQTFIDFTKASGANRWPDQNCSWCAPGDTLQYTVWLFFNISGRWYGTGTVERWFGAPPVGPITDGNCGWYYNSSWAPMHDFSVRIGDQIGFMVTAGDTRLPSRGFNGVFERSNTIIVQSPYNLPTTCPGETTSPPIDTPLNTPPPPPNGALLCSDINWGGTCEAFEADDPDLRDNPVGNDAVSSLRTSTTIQLCSDINFGGICQVFMADDLNLAVGNPNLVGAEVGNDRASSIKIGYTLPIGPTNDSAGTCPAGYIWISGATKEAGDPLMTPGYFCDDTQGPWPSVKGLTNFPMPALLVCTRTSGTGFIADSWAWPCNPHNYSPINNPGWDLSTGFPTKADGTAIPFRATVSCPGTTSFTLNDANFDAGAWTTTPNTRLDVCVPGTVVTPTPIPTLTPTPTPSPTLLPTPPVIPPPTGPPVILSFTPTTIQPGQRLEIFGSNLTENVTFNSVDGEVTTMVGWVSYDRTKTIVEVPITIPEGLYTVTVFGEADETTSADVVKVIVSDNTLGENSFLPTSNYSTTTIGSLVQTLFTYAFYLMGLAVFIMIVWGGFLWLTSAGNSSQIAQAKHKIFNAIIGAIILLSAYIILYTINPALLGGGGGFVLPGLR